MTDDQSEQLSEQLSKQTAPESADVETLIQVRGQQTLRILNFFYNNPGQWKIIQVSRILKMPYQSVRSALKRLSRFALVTRLRESWIMLDSRREVAGNVLKNPGKKVSINTGLEKCSLSTKVDQGRVPRSSEPLSEQFEVVLKSWKEIVDWKAGWPENKRVTKIHLPKFIIAQLRLQADTKPRTLAGWVSVHRNHFKMQISKLRSVQLHIGTFEWKEELGEFLKGVPNLEDSDLDLIWNKIAERCKHVKITREFHVVDPGIATVKPNLFRGSGSWRQHNSNYDEVLLFPSTTSECRSGVHRADERRGQRVHQSLRSVCNCSTFREKVLTVDGGHVGESAEGIPGAIGASEEAICRELGTSQRGIRAQVQGIAIAAGGL